MATYKLPSIETLSEVPDDEFLQIIDALFEPNDSLHAVIEEAAEEPEDSFKVQEYKSYDELIDAIKQHINYLVFGGRPGEGDEMLFDILQAHPRLGAKKVESAQSQAEQAQLNQGGEEEARKLAALNEEYEKRFRGLRYVVFVNGRSREEVMKNMRERIDRGSIGLEREEALQVCAKLSQR